MGAGNCYDGIDEFAVRLIKKMARRLIGSAGFTESDRDDLEQEMAMDLLLRLPKYQEGRAARKAFIAVAIRHKAASLIEAQEASNRDYRKVAYSLDQDSEDEKGEVTSGYDRLDKEILLEPSDRPGSAEVDQMCLALDIDRVLRKLSPDLRQLCELLAEFNVTEIARTTGQCRDTIYRRIKTLQQVFESEGLRDFFADRSDTF